MILSLESALNLVANVPASIVAIPALVAWDMMFTKLYLKQEQSERLMVVKLMLRGYKRAIWWPVWADSAIMTFQR